MELRSRRALLVVAEAGINQDRVAPGLDDKAVEAEEKVAGRRIDQLCAGVVGVLVDRLRIEIGEEVSGAINGPSYSAMR